MRCEKIQMKHRSLIMECFAGLDDFISDFTFSIIYVYRFVYEYRIIFEGEPVFIAGTNSLAQNFLTPLKNLSSMDPVFVANLINGYDFIYPVAEKWAGNYCGSPFSTTCRDGEMDYLFKVADIASYSGGKYNKRRNRLKHFTAGNDASCDLFRPSDIGKAFNILAEWQQHLRLPETETDFVACREALENFSLLGLSGMIYYSERRPVGFLIGEALNSRVYLIHFVKGLPGFNGLYEFMFNRFARTLSGFEYLNMEEDMGKENLRITKSSYHPAFLVKKCRIYLRNHDSSSK